MTFTPSSASTETHSTTPSNASPAVTTATSTSRAPMLSMASASLSTTIRSQPLSHSSSISAAPNRPTPTTSTFLGCFIAMLLLLLAASTDEHALARQREPRRIGAARQCERQRERADAADIHRQEHQHLAGHAQLGC